MQLYATIRGIKMKRKDEENELETIKIEVELNKPLHDAIAEYLKVHPMYPNGIPEFVAEATLQKIERVHLHC